MLSPLLALGSTCVILVAAASGASRAQTPVPDRPPVLPPAAQVELEGKRPAPPAASVPGSPPGSGVAPGEVKVSLESAETGTSAADALLPQVLWLEGKVTVSAGVQVGGEPVMLHAQIADHLHPGERLVVERGARLWLLVGPDDLIAAQGPLTLSVSNEGIARQGPNAPGDEGGVRRVRVAGLPASSETPVAWEAGNDRPGFAAADGLVLVEPVETSVREARPALSWKLPEGRDRVDLTLWRLEDDGSLTPVEVWRGLHGAELRPWQALTRQRYYLWRARALAPPPSQSSSATGHGGAAEVQVAVWFRLLGTDEVTTVQRAMTALSKHQADDPHAAMALQVLRALLLERYGLLREAEEAWGLIAARRPDRQGLERRLARLKQRRLLTPRRLLRAPAATYGLSEDEVRLPTRGEDTDEDPAPARAGAGGPATAPAGPRPEPVPVEDSRAPEEGEGAGAGAPRVQALQAPEAGADSDD